MKGLGIAWLASSAALTRTGLWRLRTVALAYLLPVFMIGWFGIDTPREAWGDDCVGDFCVSCYFRILVLRSCSDPAYG